VFALVALTVPSASARWEDLNAPTTVVAYRMTDGTVQLAWSPAAWATSYVVYRGTEPGKLDRIHEGQVPAFYDSNAPVADTIYYVIGAIDPSGTMHTTSVTTTNAKGNCIAMSTSLSFSVSVANCLGMLPEL
jgi:hypothetical protein